MSQILQDDLLRIHTFSVACYEQAAIINVLAGNPVEAGRYTLVDRRDRVGPFYLLYSQPTRETMLFSCVCVRNDVTDYTAVQGCREAAGRSRFLSPR